MIKYVVVASRGRSPSNMINNVADHKTVQNMELNMSGTTNTLTSVQKDNWIIEIRYGEFT